jgi:NAD(P)H-dependent FMN reductase
MAGRRAAARHCFRIEPDGNAKDWMIPAELRERAANAAGLVVASPEYARGYPGALKNSLDWLVGSQ